MHMGPDAERLRIAAVANQNVRGGARRAPVLDSPLEVLRSLLKATPLTVDLDELAVALKNAEVAKVPAFELKKGIAKMEYAERVQTAARIKAFAAEVEVVIHLDDLDVDVEKLLEMIEFAEDKPGVPEGLIAKAEAKLQSAEEAQERRRQEIRAAATAKISGLCKKPLMLLDEVELTAAATEGIEADVSDELKALVHEKTRAAARRSAALSNLNYLATAEPFELNTAAMRVAMAEASEAGVPMSHVKEAQYVLRNAEQQQVRAHVSHPPLCLPSPLPPPGPQENLLWHLKRTRLDVWVMDAEAGPYRLSLSLSLSLSAAGPTRPSPPPSCPRSAVPVPPS
jgi:hypothetical protein